MADGAAFDLRKDLAELGCRIEELHVAPQRMTPTYLKPRDDETPGLAGEHSRYDTKNRPPTPDALQQRVIASLDRLLPTVDIDGEAGLPARELEVTTTEADAYISDDADPEPSDDEEPVLVTT